MRFSKEFSYYFLDINLTLDKNRCGNSSLLQVSYAQNRQAQVKILKAFLILRLNTTESFIHKVKFVVAVRGTCFLANNVRTKKEFSDEPKKVSVVANV